MKPISDKLYKAQSKLDAEINAAEKLLSVKIDFRFGILYQPADGFVIVDEDAHNAPLSSCLAIIKRKGVLTKEDYLDETI